MDCNSKTKIYEPISIDLESVTDAESALHGLKEVIDHYGVALVSDLYDLIGRSSGYATTKYGWINMTGFKLEYTKTGGRIITPKPLPIT